MKIRETATELIIENQLIGLTIRKTLQAGQGPIAQVRLRSGKWTGDSSLVKASAVKDYSVEVVARGPVFIEIRCRAVFADEGQWTLSFRIERGEPVVLVDESFDAPGGGSFRVNLGDKAYRPAHVFYRSGMGGSMGSVNSQPIGAGRTYLLGPWLYWWGAERQGNWFAIYTAAPKAEPSIDLDKNAGKNAVEKLLGKKEPQIPDPHPDMLMVGLLRPSVWKDPKWSGHARHVGLHVPAQVEDGRVTVSFPLGGGRRAWMLGTPDKAQSISVLSAKNRRVAPLPQHYLIKHGDFPLDVVKDYVLEWNGDHENYPRLFVGKQELQALRSSLKSNPRELKRWISEQPIDKYNIGGPLREYFASGSPQLGGNIVERTAEWLHTVVHDDLLQQNSRVTLGVAPHSQAVLLVPTLNLTDAALSVESLTPELRRQFLAQLTFLGYVVNRDDYWSPSRLTQTALTASLKNRGSVTLLVYPRLKTEPSPKVIWHAGGRIAEVISSVGSDYVSVSPKLVSSKLVSSKAAADAKQKFQTSDKKLSFQGDAGAVQVRSKRVTLTLGAAGTVRLGGKTLTAEAAATKSEAR